MGSLCRIAFTGKGKAHFRFLEKGITGMGCEAKGRAAGLTLVKKAPAGRRALLTSDKA
jgi:hypothetical protein